LKARGFQVDFKFILASIQERDRIDSSRELAPLRIGEGAIVINTNELDISQVFDQMLSFIEHGKTRI
jgi:cytidylate kinase